MMKTTKQLLCILWLVITTALALSSCHNNETETSVNPGSVFEALDWGENCTTYVIGHKSPDTDAVCSAIAYANLMKALGYDCEPRVAGRLNNETKMVLKIFGIEEPTILESAEGCRIILTDHSELQQAIPGIDQAKVLQIIDHHALGSVTSSSPLYCRIMPVGATCTVVYTSYKVFGVTIDREMAGLMFSGLLSDTNNMTSTTVSTMDSMMYAELLPLSGIEDAESYYAEMVDSLASYTGMTDEEIFFSDYKDYSTESIGCDVGIGVINSLSEATQVDLRKRMYAFMPTALQLKQRSMVFTMILNKKANYTDILFYGEGAKEAAEKAFGKSEDGYIRCQGQMSRKNDFVPAISEVLQQ